MALATGHVFRVEILSRIILDTWRRGIPETREDFCPQRLVPTPYFIIPHSLPNKHEPADCWWKQRCPSTVHRPPTEQQPSKRKTLFFVPEQGSFLRYQSRSDQRDACDGVSFNSNLTGFFSLSPVSRPISSSRALHVLLWNRHPPPLRGPPPSREDLRSSSKELDRSWRSARRTANR